MLGLTQAQAAELVAVSSQQFRKYEKRLTTISFERLYQVAQALRVEIAYFFEGIELEISFQKPLRQERMLLELVHNFTAIENSTYQEQVLGLIRALAEADSRTRRAVETVRSRSRRTSAPVKFVIKLVDLWAIGESEAAKLLGLESLADFHDLVSGAKQPATRDTKDRIKHLLRIREALHGLFRDVDAERAWLREARPELNGESPLALLCEGSMEGLLSVSQFVQWMVGR